MHRRLRRLAEIFPVIASPVFQYRCFAEADQSLVGVQLDDDIDADRRGETRPLVHPPRREANWNRFDLGDFHLTPNTLAHSDGRARVRVVLFTRLATKYPSA